MKPRHLSVFVFLVVATALLLAGGAAAQTPCDEADKLFKLQLYDAAQTNYTDLLNKDPTLTCAQNGSLEVQHAEAIKAYEKGRAYENASQVKEARDAYVKALDKYPTYGDAQKALARMNGGILTLAYTLYTFLRPALEKIVVIAIVALVLYALIYQIWPWIRGFYKPRLDILDFDKGETSLEIGKGMAAMVEEEIIWSQKERHSHHEVKLVSGPINKLVIPVDIKSISSPIKTLSDLIEWLFPPNVITLSGCLEKQGDKGVGLTLSLVKSQTGEIIASRTIWQKEYDPAMKPSAAKDNDPEPYYHLVEPIAIWTVFQLGTSPKVKNGTLFKLLVPICSCIHRFAPCEKYLIKRTDEFKILNTKSWPSYAYFRAGVRWGNEGNVDNARKMYLKALKEDPDFLGALLNLGSLYSKDEDYLRTLKILEQVKELTNPYDPDYGFTWYTYKYMLANAYHYIAKKYKEYIKEAYKKVEEIANTIEKSIEQKNNDAALNCCLYKAGEDADILVDKIKKANNILQEYNQNKSDILDESKKFRNNIDELQKNVCKVSLDELLTAKKDVNELSDKIKEMNDNSDAVFDFNMEKAKKEATELVKRIQKEIRELPLELEDESKKLLDIIKEAIYELQNNKEKSLDCVKRAEKQANILEETIMNANDALQNTKNKSLKCYLNESKDLAITFLFSWKDIPENDNGRLIEFLKQNFGIDWVKTAKIEKIDNGKTIKVSTEKNYLSLKLNDEQTEVNLKIDDDRTDKFVVLIENDKINIYDITINRILKIENRLEEGLNEAKKVAEKLDRRIRLSVTELKQSENYSLKLSLIKFEPMAICVKEEIFAEGSKNVSEKPFKSKKPSEYDPGFQYNKACYYSVAGENKTKENEENERNKDYDKALLRLKYALEIDSNKAEWAKKDPSLIGVREDKMKKNEFYEIIKKYGTSAEQEDSLPLAGLAIIGDYARQLKEQGITSYCDLTLKADTLEARAELSKKLGISTQLLHRWALLADLMRIVGDTKYVNLLEAADYGSIEALNNVSDPCELANLLNQVNQTQSLVKQLPSMETVQQWVQDVRQTKPKVL